MQTWKKSKSIIATNFLWLMCKAAAYAVAFLFHLVQLLGDILTLELVFIYSGPDFSRDQFLGFLPKPDFLVPLF